MKNNELQNAELDGKFSSNLFELKEFVRKQYEAEQTEELKEIYEKLERSLNQDD